MPVDLTSQSVILRRGVVIQADHLLILESQGLSSRLWRVPFDQVTRVTVTHGLPWVRLVLLPSLFGLLALPFLVGMFTEPLASAVGLGVIAGVFLTIGIALLLWYAICGKTTLTLTYGPNKQRTMPFVARPAKMRDFLTRLTQGIAAVQASQWQAYLAANAASPQDDGLADLLEQDIPADGGRPLFTLQGQDAADDLQSDTPGQPANDPIG